MNLKKLFEAQRVLDERIMEKRPELKNQSNLDWKILALQVEIGELANEWRGFKKWSDNQNPNTISKTPVAYYDPENDVFKSEFVEHNPMLFELVDCLHFILSIGEEEVILHGTRLPVSLELRADITPYKSNNVIDHFNSFFNQVGYFYDCCEMRVLGTDSEIHEQYVEVWRGFVGLGEMLGFTWEQIEVAYFEKNAINHQRQESGY